MIKLFKKTLNEEHQEIYIFKMEAEFILHVKQ